MARTKRPRCYYCGLGLSARYAPSAEDRLLRAIFNIAARSCPPCAERMYAKRGVPEVSR